MDKTLSMLMIIESVERMRMREILKAMNVSLGQCEMKNDHISKGKGYAKYVYLKCIRNGIFRRDSMQHLSFDVKIK